MRAHEPFLADDLADLDDSLLSRADAVVAMREIFDGNYDQRTIGLRHDVDDNEGSFAAALALAGWEAERGYRSTFFLLHTASYWRAPWFPAGLAQIAAGGHEIGLHANAVAEALRTGRDPGEIVAEAVSDLRGYGHQVRGVVAHGDELCRTARFVNDEMFQESARPAYGDPGRTLEYGGVKVTLRPVSRSVFGFDYDPNWLSRGMYLSDSGGRWSLPFADVAAGFPYKNGATHLLIHSDWWGDAFPATRRQLEAA